MGRVTSRGQAIESSLQPAIDIITTNTTRIKLTILEFRAKKNNLKDEEDRDANMNGENDTNKRDEIN